MGHISFAMVDMTPCCWTNTPTGNDLSSNAIWVAGVVWLVDEVVLV